jgi:hypothetical protein
MDPIEYSRPSAKPTRAKLEERLRPGTWSTLGFLGADESLDEVRSRDAESLARLGISYDQLADALGDVLATALDVWRTPVPEDKFEEVLAHQTDFPNFYRPETIPHFDLHHLPDIQSGILVGHLQVFIVNYKDWQYCPWGCEAYNSSDFLVVNRQTGESVTAPELMPHLIRTHHFFGGLGSPYRTDPERLARVVELVVG